MSRSKSGIQDDDSRWNKDGNDNEDEDEDDESFKDDGDFNYNEDESYLEKAGALVKKRTRKIDSVKYAKPKGKRRRAVSQKDKPCGKRRRSNPLRAGTDRWMGRFQTLVDFQKINGHCNVSKGNSGTEKGLAEWVWMQRGAKRKGKLSAEREKLLTDIGFEFNRGTTHDGFFFMYKKLLEFKEENGHCLVPSVFDRDRRLGNWVANQRAAFHAGKLSVAKKKHLDKAGFVWNIKGAINMAQPSPVPREKIGDGTTWDYFYHQLVLFHREYHHCDVSQKQPENKKVIDDKELAEWVNTQHIARKEGNLSEDHEKRLMEIGFFSGFETVRNDSEGVWMAEYKALCDFKKKYGYVNASAWLLHQKSCFFRKTLSTERVELLARAGIPWIQSRRGNKGKGRSEGGSNTEANFVEEVYLVEEVALADEEQETVQSIEGEAGQERSRGKRAIIQV